MLVVMGGMGHFQRLRSMMDALVERDVNVSVLTDREFEGAVQAAGAGFVDLYGRHTLDAADAESRPIPCRYVSFAGRFGREVAQDVASLGPSLIISDSFALIGRIIAEVLGIPHINVCAGHDVDPTRFISQIESERVSISDDCHQAVEILREDFGLEDASPFSYGTSVSTLLNIYCEPESFVSAETRQALEPIAFFGSLPPLAEIEARRRPGRRRWFGANGGRRKVYVSFGTIAWWYYANDALAALRVISETFAARHDVDGLISLGNADVDAGAVRALTNSRVSVERYVDQWQVLNEADVFVTHHGLNSTHESIFSQVPMISYPFFGDQPSMAATCQDLGVAVPLGGPPRHVLDRRLVGDALDTCLVQSPRLATALTACRDHELDVMARRPEVVDRILQYA